MKPRKKKSMSQKGKAKVKGDTHPVARSKKTAKANPVRPAPKSAAGKPIGKKVTQLPPTEPGKKLSLKEQIERARTARLIAQGKLRSNGQPAIDPLSYAASRKSTKRKFDAANQQKARMEAKQKKLEAREQKKKLREEARQKKAEARATAKAAKVKVKNFFKPIKDANLIKKYGAGSVIYDAPIPKEIQARLVELLKEYVAERKFTGVVVVNANGDGIVLQDANMPKRNWTGQYLYGYLACWYEMNKPAK